MSRFRLSGQSQNVAAPFLLSFGSSIMLVRALFPGDRVELLRIVWADTKNWRNRPSPSLSPEARGVFNRKLTF
jgi:hypothetical protein